MLEFKISFCMVIVFLCAFKLSPQEKNIRSQFVNKEDTTDSEYKFYIGYIHQHHDFYDKAFSYQGIEFGTKLNHQLLLGGYGNTFASVLEVSIENVPTYLQIWQVGAVGSIFTNDTKFIYAGLLLNIGYISIVADTSNFSLFKPNDPVNKISGLVLVPQIYTEMNITKWMQFRLGVGYDFYFFKDQPVIKKSDLQNISFNFGFLFGIFSAGG